MSLLNAGDFEVGRYYLLTTRKKKMSSRIKMAAPSPSLRSVLLVNRSLISGAWVQGPSVKSLEAVLPSVLNLDSRAECVAVSSGTQALILALLALDVKSGDEVLVPAFSFAASAHAVSMVGARPVFFDVDRSTMNGDLSSASNRVTQRTKAIILVHLFGHFEDTVPWAQFAQKHRIYLVEDAAQAAGASSANSSIASHSSLATLSFYPTKNLAAAEGGAIVTTNPEIASRVRALRNQGMRARYQFVEPGSNARMNELSAGIALGEAKKFRRRQARRHAIASRYSEGLAGGPWTLPKTPLGGVHGWHQFTLLCDTSAKRGELVMLLEKASIDCAIFYPDALSKLDYYRSGREEDRCPVAESIVDLVVSIPIHPRLSDLQVSRVIKVLSSGMA